MLRFVILILNYKSAKETQLCVQSIENLTKKVSYDVQIVIVDNDSKDGSLKLFHELYEGKSYIHLIANKENGGFSCGNNMGYGYIYENLNAEFVIMINSDIECRQKELLLNIDKIYEETKFSVLGPDVYAYNMKIHQNPIRRNLPGLQAQLEELKSQKQLLKKYQKMESEGKEYVDRNNKKIWEEKIYKIVKRMHLDALKKGTLSYKKKYENIVIHGSAIIFSRKYMDKYIHALYPEPFYYGEEDLLYLKCVRNGDKIIYDPRVKVWHAAGASATNTKGERYTLKREIFRYENFIKTKKLYINVLQDEEYFINEIRK